ncbi:hypothetical protein [Chitinophaga jiangningensis]|nr:hypothetical protein [Chitinophaga jiangningensis]
MLQEHAAIGLAFSTTHPYFYKGSPRASTAPQDDTEGVILLPI